MDPLICGLIGLTVGAVAGVLFGYWWGYTGARRNL